MKTKQILTSLLTILMLTSLIACKPSTEDLRMSEDILGCWQARDKNGNPQIGIPYYYFDTDNKGFTTLDGVEKDNMKWEIKKKQLNVFYEQSVANYTIGYDNYNSRSLFRIKSVTTEKFKATIFYHSGLQSDLEFYKTELPVE